MYMSAIKKFFDELAAAAYEAVADRVAPAQVNKLLEIFEATRDVDMVLLFLARQFSRGEWRGNSARRLYGVLSKVRGEGGSDADVRNALGVFKWLFEAGRRRLPRTRPRTPAQEGYYMTYLRECLG